MQNSQFPHIDPSAVIYQHLLKLDAFASFWAPAKDVHKILQLNIFYSFEQIFFEPGKLCHFKKQIPGRAQLTATDRQSGAEEAARPQF